MRWRFGAFALKLITDTLTANRALKLPNKDGTLAVNSTRSEAFEALVGPGLVQLQSGAGSAPTVASETIVGAVLRTAADAAAARSTIGVGTISTQSSSDVAITGGTVNGVSVGATRAFTSSSNLTAGFWAGVDTTPRCVFSAGLASTAWTIDNNNGDFRWFTPGNVRMSIRASDSMLSAYGPIAPKLYTPQSRPAANSLYYGAMIAIYDPNFNPSIFIAWTDNTNWYRISGTTLLP